MPAIGANLVERRAAEHAALGTRVALAYLLSGIPFFGVRGIWLAVPIGWILADAVGLGVYAAKKKTMLQI